MRRSLIGGLLIGSGLFLVGFFSGAFVGKSRGIPFVGTEKRWAIGIYSGDSPWNLHAPPGVDNPVLTADDVTDIQADFVADPFMIEEDSVWYMFFEVMNSETQHGDVGLAISEDGFKWTYSQIVLDESFHLSYPNVFRSGSDIYMMPETEEAHSIRLYKAMKFPYEWEFIGTLMDGNFDDPSPFFFEDAWWIFAETNPRGNDTLCLYYADELTGPWVEHPACPIIHGDASIARPGGGVLVLPDVILRYAQDDEPTYGNQVRAFRILDLSYSGYKEESTGTPVIMASGSGWNADGMHHIDVHQIGQSMWIASVDGFDEVLQIGLEH